MVGKSDEELADEVRRRLTVIAPDTLWVIDNLTDLGLVNALLNASGAISHRYWAGVTFGVLMLLFGLFSPLTTQLGLAVPTVFIVTLGGLALLNVLRDCFAIAFGGRFRMGALVAFIATTADLTLFNIGGAFWGLVFGWLVSRLLEPADFASSRGET